MSYQLLDLDFGYGLWVMSYSFVTATSHIPYLIDHDSYLITLFRSQTFSGVSDRCFYTLITHR
jgi:hypothetical protein